MAFAKVLTLDEVPGYLRTSDLFRVLTGTDDYFNGEFAIDAHDDLLAVACKSDLLINNIDDLIELLQTLKYWRVAHNEWPIGLYRYLQ